MAKPTGLNPTVALLEDRLKILRKNDPKPAKPESAQLRLDKIQEELRTCIGFGKVLFLHIGALLSEAKELLRNDAEGWKEYYGSLGMSDQTAANYIVAWSLCLANPQLAEGVNLTVLYRVGAKGFPAVLRDALIESGALHDGIKPTDIDAYRRSFTESGEVVNEELQRQLELVREKRKFEPLRLKLQGMVAMLERADAAFEREFGDPTDDKHTTPDFYEMRQEVSSAIDAALRVLNEPLGKLNEICGTRPKI
jgi:hypothetical protein